MLFTAASRGFAIDGFLVFPRVRAGVRVRVREALSYGGHDRHESSKHSALQKVSKQNICLSFVLHYCLLLKT